MVIYLFWIFYIKKNFSAKLLYQQVHDETAVLSTKKHSQRELLFQKKKSHCKIVHKGPAQQISLIIWDDKLKVKFAWNSWCEMPHKGDQDSLQNVPASNDDLVSFQKDVISRMMHSNNDT